MISDGIEIVSFGIERVWKMIFENEWDPLLLVYLN